MFYYTEMFVFAVYKQTGAELATEGYLMLLSPAFLRDCQEIVESLARHMTVLRPSEEYPALKSAVDSGNYDFFAAILSVNDETNSQTEIGNPIVEIRAYSNCESLLRTFLPIPYIFHPFSDSESMQDYFSRGISHEGAGSVETLGRIFSRNMKINFRAENGETFLHLAIGTGDFALIGLALQLCINIDAQYANGETALHGAASRGNELLVELLLENGANVNIENIHGSTPLLYATLDETTFILLKFGANMNIKSEIEVGKKTLLERCGECLNFGSQGQVLLDFDFNCVPKSRYPEGFTEHAQSSVERQAVKLSALGFQQVSYLADIARNATHLTEIYENEVARLKEKRVGDTDITFYDIVTKGVYRNSINVKNENFTKAVQSRDYESLFPLYATLIECEFEKGLHRRKFLDRGISAFSSLVEDSYVFPDDIKEEIIRYCNEPVCFTCRHVTHSVNFGR